MVHDRGASELSLREVASEIGVTHAAPRRYFPDRAALLSALAVEGFGRLGSRLRQAAAAAPGYHSQVRAVAAAYLDFCVSEANLVEVMFAHKRGHYGAAVAQEAAEALAPIQDVFRRGQAEGVLPAEGAQRIAVVFLATLQGLAGLINCGIVSIDDIEGLIEEATRGLPLGAPER
jgi:AcrR family transcriptional regulator